MISVQLPLLPLPFSHQIKGAEEKLLKLSQMRSYETCKKTVTIHTTRWKALKKEGFLKYFSNSEWSLFVAIDVQAEVWTMFSLLWTRHHLSSNSCREKLSFFRSKEYQLVSNLVFNGFIFWHKIRSAHWAWLRLYLMRGSVRSSSRLSFHFRIKKLLWITETIPWIFLLNVYTHDN